jgi:hypothetical protein
VIERTSDLASSASAAISIVALNPHSFVSVHTA